MNSFCMSLIAVLFFFLTPTAYASGSSSAKVSFIEGQVLYKISRSEPWRPLKLDYMIPENSQVKLPRNGDGRVELTLPDQSIVRMSAPAEVTLSHLKRKSSFGIKINLIFGHLWSKIKKLGGQRNFEVATKNAVLGVRGTAYDTFVAEDQSVDVRVFEGSVAASEGVGDSVQQKTRSLSLATRQVAGPKEVSLTQWLVILKEKQRLQISASGLPTEPEDMDITQERKSPWVQWNMERDKSLENQSNE